MTEGEKQYDVALSFAGEDRSYAKALAEALKSRNISVFYDEYEMASLWGKDLYTYLSDLYQNQALYCVMFISKYYASKLWTNHERKSAQARAFKESSEYILPIRLDSTEIPGIPSTIGYLDWNRENVNSIADAIITKLGKESKLLKFQYEYKFIPEPGIRKWYQLDEIKWVEQYPSGHTSTFVVVDRVTVGETSGFVVRKVRGDVNKAWVGDYEIEVFIPDPNSKCMYLLFRHNFDGKWEEWKPCGEVTYT